MSTTENAAVTVDVVENDSDLDATDELSVSAASIGSATNSADDEAVEIDTATVSFSGTEVEFDPGTDFDYLAAGETATVVINYTVTDDDGNPLTDESTLTITVTGTNDAPVAQADTGDTTENAAVTVDVVENDSDLDATDELSVSAASIGSATNSADDEAVEIDTATVSFSGTEVEFDPGTDFDYLAAGETATVVINYTVTDDDGNPLTDESTLTITVTGTNDAPVAQADTGDTTENAAVTVDVVENDSDLDATDELSVSAASIGSATNSADDEAVEIDTATVSFSGTEVEFDPGTDFDYLAAGETATVVINYTVTDDDGNPLTDESTLTITVTGTNDAPVAQADTGDTTENAAVTVDVVENDSDLDATDELSVSAASIGSATNSADDEAVEIDTATVSFSGTEVEFDPGTDFDYLAAGETATVVINYTVTDDDGNPLTDESTLTITVTGTNDAPVAQADTGDTTENAAVTVDVVENDSDLDATDELSVSAASIGSATNSADDEAVEIDTATVSFSGTEVEFDPGTDFDYLAAGETATVVINYTVTDDDGNPLTDESTLTITVTGTNDAPVAQADTGDTTENAAVTVDVIENDSDLDATDELSVSAASIGSATNSADDEAVEIDTATVSFSGTEVEFDPGTDFDYLAAGETATVVINYTVTDDDGNPLTDESTLTITVTGTNDAPVARADTDETNDGTAVTVNVVENDSDLDASDVLSVSAASINTMTNGADDQAVAINTAAVSFNGTDIEFDPGTDFDYLKPGETATVVINYTVTDDSGSPQTDDSTLTITVTGTNDAPVATADTADISENGSVSVDVIENDSDIDDANDALSVSAANISSMTNSADNETVEISTARVSFSGREVNFNPGADFDYLAAGETATVVINYTVTDDDGNPLTDESTLTITVTGTNDEPEAEADIGEATENAAVTVDVVENDSDLDATDELSVSAASIGSATNNADDESVEIDTATVSFSGTEVEFHPGTDFDYLAAGETATVVINYTVTDDDGNPLTDESTLTITVTGTNDAPVAQADTGDTTENAAVTVDVVENDSDLDATDELSVSAASISSATNSADDEAVEIDTATVSFSGTEVEFDPGTDFDYLAAGETATVVINYTVTDDDGNPLTDESTLTITVTGTNDAPVAQADTGEHHRKRCGYC